MAAKLVNQALVGIHAQAACEAIRLAEKLGLEDLVQLKELLSASWGQSKILDLVLADFIAARQQSSNNSFEAALQVLQETKSAAPLRNMDKDFACIEKEISLHSSLNILNSYPLLKDTQEKIHKACAESRLKDAPFASLTIVE